MAGPISPGQIKTALVDANGYIRKEWYNAFQSINAAVVQTIINTTTIIDNESTTLFDNAVTPIDPAAIASLIGAMALTSVKAPVPCDSSLMTASGVRMRENYDNSWMLAARKSDFTNTWTPYTATVTPASSMTYAATSQDSAYVIIGHLCGHRVNLAGTLAGTASASIALSLPLGAYGSQSSSGYAIIGSNNVPILGSISGSTVTIQRYDGANFALGSITIVITGIWQTLQ